MNNNDIFYQAAWTAAKLATYAAQYVAYPGYEEALRKRFKSFQVDPDYGADFWRKVCALSDKEKHVLGFYRFGEDKGMCLPLWIWSCLPDDMLICGKKVKYLDNDSRFGRVYWSDKDVLRGYEV